jgi:hypothetical protein
MGHIPALLYTLGLLPFGLPLRGFSHVLNVIREPFWDLHIAILCIMHPVTGQTLNHLIYSQVNEVTNK